MVLLQNIQQAPECTKQGAPAPEEGEEVREWPPQRGTWRTIGMGKSISLFFL